MVYEDVAEAKFDLLTDLLKKKERLQNNLIKVEIEIKLLEKDLQGGASLDKYLSDDVLKKVENKLNDDLPAGGSIEKVEINRVR
ncbi:hypothetical protein [Methanobacterium formicicum]|uniref:Uncharacterized protein n=1 Tax=Methanobacterium formicicum TaxID=2162 RepID=A0A843AKX0_METFO|nr:hypothetical protein [Methanobacterium formicicum]MBF4474558.1 hypothetical protein [Methanobacterium formicicum]